VNKGMKRKGRSRYAPASMVVLEPLEEALPEQCRDERCAASNPALTGDAVLVGPSSSCQAGLQAVVLDLRTYPGTVGIIGKKQARGHRPNE
jgi:hypothetical protein